MVLAPGASEDKDKAGGPERPEASSSWDIWKSEAHRGRRGSSRVLGHPPPRLTPDPLSAHLPTPRWLYEGLSREKAEELLLLPGNPGGAFLIRESQTRRGG